MPKKIIDEFTDRTDLTSAQKFSLRHPDRVKASRRSWQIQHLDKALEANQRFLAKKRSERIKAKLSSQSKMVLGYNNVGRFKRREILLLHAKGKDIGSIAVWTNTPVSTIKAVIAQLA